MGSLLARLFPGLRAAEKRLRAQNVVLQDKLRRELRARYDAAQTSNDNRKHWAATDALSANSANSPAVRKTLRERARYEVANNSYAHGIMLTVANDTVGTGPRLQVTTEDEVVNDQVEAAFSEWAEGIDLASKLHTMRLAKLEDGEAFAVLFSNPGNGTRVTLDLRLVEADQVATPYPTFGSDEIDGIVFDAFGNPETYRVLADHPGDVNRITTSLDFTSVPARAMLHYFRTLRPGQARGIPEITPALPLFAQLRRYTLAVIAAAEVAADLALVIYTDSPAEETEASGSHTMATMELEKGMATVLPDGWKLGQAKPEQPSTTYSEFKRAILTEIARCLNVPWCVAAGDSSSYNYASGRLDYQVYFKSLRVEQALLKRCVLDRVLGEFLSEATLIEGLLPQSLRLQGAMPLPHQWFFDGHDHVDPLKEANAQDVRIKNHMTTYAEEYGRRGLDWIQQFRQRKKELELMRALELPEPDVQRIEVEEEEDEAPANGEGKP